MTLDEAIRHAEEVMAENLEKTKDRKASDPIAINCFECADEHRQLAEWLKDYKRLLEQEPCEDTISRAYIEPIIEELENICVNGDEHILDLLADIKNAPPVTPQQKMGRWIYGEDNLGTGRDGWYCNQCGHFEFWDYSSNMKSAKLNLPNPCPNCGVKMESEE